MVQEKRQEAALVRAQEEVTGYKVQGHKIFRFEQVNLVGHPEPLEPEPCNLKPVRLGSCSLKFYLRG